MKKLAILSDIHGNLHALDAVLNALEQHSPDLTINLGDLFSGGLQPKATAERVRSLDHLVVRGNHERQLLEGAQSQSDLLASQELSSDDLNWIAGLPTRIEPIPGVICIHGSPRSDSEYLLDTVDEHGAHISTEEEVYERLSNCLEAKVVVCGHSHLSRVVTLSNGILVVNPGSVGWPAYSDDVLYPHIMESGTPHARFALLEWKENDWKASIHTIEYDWEAAARIAEQNNRVEIAYNLRTGRSHPVPLSN